MAPKKKLSFVRTRSRLMGAQRSTNPFEVCVYRKKQVILGQKSKSICVLVGISRSTTIRKRKKTLLPEYKGRSKSNLFIDRRFGGHALRRMVLKDFAVENMADKSYITHLGKSIRDMKMYDDISVTEEDQVDEDDVGSSHFGGLFLRKHTFMDVEGEENPLKNRKQVLKEVVSKSKIMKYERQSEKQVVEEFRDKVDSDLKDIWGTLSKSEHKIQQEQAKVQKGFTTEEGPFVKSLDDALSKFNVERQSYYSGTFVGNHVHRTLKTKLSLQAVPDEYDKTVCELMFEQRGQLTSRMHIEVRSKELQQEEAYSDCRIEGFSLKQISLEQTVAQIESVHVPFLLSKEDGGVFSEFAVKQNDSENFSDIGEHEGDQLCQGSSLNLDAIFDQFVELSQKPLLSNLNCFDKVARLVFKTCQYDTMHGVKFFREILRKYHREWIITKRNPKYPPFSELMLFKLINFIFPSTDLEHPVVTPAMLLMVLLLRKCVVKTRQQMVHGLFVCQILMEYLSKSSCYVPELVNYLTSCCGCFCNGKIFQPFSTKTNIVCDSNSDIHAEDYSSLVFHFLCTCQDTLEGSIAPWEVNYVILKHTLVLGVKLLTLICDSPSYKEVLAPLKYNLQKIDKKVFPSNIQDLLCTAEKMSCMVATPRSSLCLKQKPKSITFYEPKIDVMTARTKSSRIQRVNCRVKEEQKGAIREIRKDSHFLARENLKETLQQDSERMKKTKQILGDLQSIQYEAKLN